MSYPPTRALTRDERDLVWRFRFFLSHDKRALTKFLKSVVWSDKGEVRQAIGDLLPIWSDISLDDALELLGPSEDYRDPRVKRFAVQQLSRADDDELVLYLLQLVQALKFDLSSSYSPSDSRTPSTLTMGQSHRLPTIVGSRPNIVSSSMMGWEQRASQIDIHPKPVATDAFADSTTLSLEDFLIQRSCLNPDVLGFQLHWYLSVEERAGGDKAVAQMYSRVLNKFHETMQEVCGLRSLASQRQLLRSNVEANVSALSCLRGGLNLLFSTSSPFGLMKVRNGTRNGCITPTAS